MSSIVNLGVRKPNVRSVILFMQYLVTVQPAVLTNGLKRQACTVNILISNKPTKRNKGNKN